MSKSITENTELTLDIKTLVIIISFIVSFVGMYFALQKDIELAKELPKPQVTRAFSYYYFTDNIYNFVFSNIFFT